MGTIKVKVNEKQILEYKNGENKSNWEEKMRFWDFEYTNIDNMTNE
jgi:hypothetical protein